MMLVCVQEIYN